MKKFTVAFAFSLTFSLENIFAIDCLTNLRQIVERSSLDMTVTTIDPSYGLGKNQADGMLIHFAQISRLRGSIEEVVEMKASPTGLHNILGINKIAKLCTSCFKDKFEDQIKIAEKVEASLPLDRLAAIYIEVDGFVGPVAAVRIFQAADTLAPFERMLKETDRYKDFQELIEKKRSEYDGFIEIGRLWMATETSPLIREEVRQAYEAWGLDYLTSIQRPRWAVAHVIDDLNLRRNKVQYRFRSWIQFTNDDAVLGMSKASLIDQLKARLKK